ncbi:hypothetical protein, partial [Gilliamella sp. Pra-s54]
FKPPLLFKSPLLCKSALFLAPLLLLSYTQDTEALSAQTSNVIHGSGPYLTLDRGQTKVTDFESLFTITMVDGDEYTPSTNTSVTNPIVLSRWRSFRDMKTIVPPTQNSITIDDLISQGKWGDDDGDGQVRASGSISVAFTDKNGATVGRTSALDICKAPYKVTLTSTGGTLSTQYGVPRSSSFSGATVDYYFSTNARPKICSVRPNLFYGGTTGIISNDHPRHAGPANIWNPSKGFLTAFTTPSSYGQNFPRTGADGLYFDLEIPTVIDGSQLSWTVNTSGSISATVSWTRPRSGTFTSPEGETYDADAWITDKSKNVTRVTLHGPRADSSQINSSNPSRLTRPSLPQTFELVGRDSSGNEVRYGFVLSRWFVNRGNKTDTPPNQTAWCRGLGYRLPRVSDLTNSNYGGLGAQPRSSGNYYQRNIGSVFFMEWGRMYSYVDAGFVYYNSYWTSDATGSNQFTVSSNNGAVDSLLASFSRSVLCTTP